MREGGGETRTAFNLKRNRIGQWEIGGSEVTRGGGGDMGGGIEDALTTSSDHNVDVFMTKKWLGNECGMSLDNKFLIRLPKLTSPE